MRWGLEIKIPWWITIKILEPCKPGVAVTDLMTGLYAHGAILAALLHRDKKGEGQQIQCNLLSTQLATLINIGSNYINAGIEGILINN